MYVPFLNKLVIVVAVMVVKCTVLASIKTIAVIVVISKLSRDELKLDLLAQFFFEILFKSNPKSDCIYHAPFDLEQQTDDCLVPKSILKW